MNEPESRPSRFAGLRLHQFEGFYHVALHGGYARAVAALRDPITEPALHQQVRKLETTLGIPLLRRAPPRRMVLTPEGRTLFTFVAPFFQGLGGVLRSLTEGPAGQIVVGAEALYAQALCARALRELQETAPAARPRLLELDVPDLISGVQQGDIDVGIASTAPLPEDLLFEELGQLGLRLMVPPDHPLASRRRIPTPKQLEGHRYVLYPPNSVGRSYTEEALRRAGIDVQAAAEVSTSQAMVAVVAAGVAPAFVPALTGPGEPRRQTRPDGLIAFDLTPLLREYADAPYFGLLLRRGVEPSGLVEIFCKVTRRLASGRSRLS